MLLSTATPEKHLINFLLLNSIKTFNTNNLHYCSRACYRGQTTHIVFTTNFWYNKIFKTLTVGTRSSGQTFCFSF